MATQTEVKLELKTVLMIVGVLALVAFAIWQVMRNTGSAPNEQTFSTKIQAPPDSTRPPGFEASPNPRSSEKQ